jgi:tryptophan 2,3-dioxygenase
MTLSPEIERKIALLEKKFAQTGQGLETYLDALLHRDYINYWDYIQLETLLSLQRPRTDVPDELIFIMYHQITELYFKLSLHEIEQLAHADANAAQLKEKIFRINQYFQALAHSFGVMETGMNREQFLQFRKALVPASGFQSMQYRIIEMGCTDFINLVHKDHRQSFNADSPIDEMYQHIYWKSGATVEETGEKAFTLRQFEAKYDTDFIEAGYRFRNINLWQKYRQLSEEDQADEDLIKAYRLLDLNVNVYWPLQHYRAAVRYLAGPPDEEATGGTNWQKYLPPRFQKRIFYPDLWSTQEKEEWGRSWVEDTVKSLRTEVK